MTLVHGCTNADISNFIFPLAIEKFKTIQEVSNRIPLRHYLQVEVQNERLQRRWSLASNNSSSSSSSTSASSTAVEDQVAWPRQTAFNWKSKKQIPREIFPPRYQDQQMCYRHLHHLRHLPLLLQEKRSSYAKFCTLITPCLDLFCNDILGLWHQPSEYGENRIGNRDGLCKPSRDPSTLHQSADSLWIILSLRCQSSAWKSWTCTMIFEPSMGLVL